VDPRDLKHTNIAFVESLKDQMPHDQAMEHAIGSGFEAVGAIELALLRHYGLRPDDSLVDVGCGAGRLAKPLASYLRGGYLGIDLVPDLVQHAQRIAGRPDWRFEIIDHVEIPEATGRADMVCLFSVLTHLLHEQSYWYLEEARRVLKPGGRVVFSFLEFANPAHVKIFLETLAAEKAGALIPMNVLIERDVIRLWAQHLGLDMQDIRDGNDVIVPEGALGQALCVLRKA